MHTLNADKKLFVVLDKKSKDESGSLGTSINTIAEKLDTSITKLQESNELLTEEIENQKRLFAAVSHDFKTPVGLIRGCAFF